MCGGQGTFNCGMLVSRIGGSGDLWRKWEKMGEREREKKRKEQCCFGLQNDLEKNMLLIITPPKVNNMPP